MKRWSQLLLVLFLFSVIYPGENCHASTLHHPSAPQLKAASQLLATAKITPSPVHIDFTAHSLTKPIWIGDLDLSGFNFSLACRTLFVQNNKATSYKLLLAQKLLFPFHFFW